MTHITPPADVLASPLLHWENDPYGRYESLYVDEPCAALAAKALADRDTYVAWLAAHPNDDHAVNFRLLTGYAPAPAEGTAP
ncbi:hypothetical protein [Streptomyces sp. NPDC088739]|uniref:hypothetical protein n=1 Tax=Streptomyces sp. NPDC088739 TaxID=3365882 RepID=UPI0037FE07E9